MRNRDHLAEPGRARRLTRRRDQYELVDIPYVPAAARSSTISRIAASFSPAARVTFTVYGVR
ncbi:hypothetical protein [Streptomyces sp. NPDC059991]|uniref:hypothetical protein n=1 Tax=unclassified Streptomyces TaxID=2593676 RepID=UPI0036889B35